MFGEPSFWMVLCRVSSAALLTVGVLLIAVVGFSQLNSSHVLLFLMVKRVFVGSFFGLFGCLSLLSQSVAALP